MKFKAGDLVRLWKIVDTAGIVISVLDDRVSVLWITHQTMPQFIGTVQSHYAPYAIRLLRAA